MEKSVFIWTPLALEVTRIRFNAFIHFCRKYFRWGTKVSFWSKISPRNLACSTIGIGLPLGRLDLDNTEGSTWSVSDSSWTKQSIALLWFKVSFLPSNGPDRPQLLILDGHDSHNFLELIDTAVKNQIHILELPAHTSNWQQPCDCRLSSAH